MKRGFAAGVLAAGALTLLMVVPADARLLEGTPRLEITRTVALAAFPTASDYCPHPVRIESKPLDGYGGLAYWWECRIELDEDWRTWGMDTLCSVVVHEYGHIARLRFPDNPTDPGHSPDPDSIMFAGHHSHAALPLCSNLGPAEQNARIEKRATRQLIARYRRAIRPKIRQRLRPKLHVQRKRLQRAESAWLEVLGRAITDGQQNRVHVPGF